MPWQALVLVLSSIVLRLLRAPLDINKPAVNVLVHTAAACLLHSCCLRQVH
jgi:hypothetical protein